MSLYRSLCKECSFSGIRVTRSFVLCVCFVDRCLSFCTFSFGHCVVCSAINGFWLPLWYLQTLLIESLSITQELYTMDNYLNKIYIAAYFMFGRQGLETTYPGRLTFLDLNLHICITFNMFKAYSLLAYDIFWILSVWIP